MKLESTTTQDPRCLSDITVFSSPSPSPTPEPPVFSPPSLSSSSSPIRPVSHKRKRKNNNTAQSSHAPEKESSQDSSTTQVNRLTRELHMAQKRTRKAHKQAALWKARYEKAVEGQNGEGEDEEAEMWKARYERLKRKIAKIAKAGVV